MRESAIEEKCRLHAEKLGIAVRKMSPMGRRGVFDRVYFLPRGRTLICEHKQPNGVKREHQKIEHRKLLELGHEAHFAFSFHEFVELLEKVLTGDKED